MFAQLQKTMNPFPTNLLKYCFKPDVLLINESGHLLTININL